MDEINIGLKLLLKTYLDSNVSSNPISEVLDLLAQVCREKAAVLRLTEGDEDSDAWIWEEDAEVLENINVSL